MVQLSGLAKLNREQLIPSLVVPTRMPENIVLRLSSTSCCIYELWPAEPPLHTCKYANVTRRSPMNDTA